jgi:hypothetical protein
MPLLSRLWQAMKDGVTADDLADDDEEDVIEVDGEDDHDDELTDGGCEAVDLTCDDDDFA